MSSLDSIDSPFPWQSPYHKLLNEDDTEKYKFSDETEAISKRTWKFYMSTVLPWGLALLFASIAFTEHLTRWQASSAGSYATGWKSDMKQLLPHIKLEQVKFTGAPAFNDEGHIYIPDPDPIEYNGNSSDVDQAWDEITVGRYVLITEEEAHAAWGDDITPFWDEKRGGYIAGFDMFHTLHCLNKIRKLTPDTFAGIWNNANHRRHHYHCLSQLRQYIMCAGDMTLYYPGIGRNYVDSDVYHTCRNFGELRSWLWERYNGSLEVKPLDLE